jgi:hypothetical protein
MKTSWLIVDKSLRAKDDGFEVEVRLPWYRGLPLSTVEVGEIRINGEEISPDAVTIRINGKERPAKDLAAFYEEYWYVLDSAYLHFPYKGAKANVDYQVQVTLVLYPPYIPGIPFRTSYSHQMHAS